MIYKVQSEFDENFSIILDKLSKYFDFIYTNNALYLGLRKYIDKDIHKQAIKKVLKPNKQYYVIEINENNLNKEPQNVIEWCKDKFIDLDKQRFEIEQQDKLKKYMQALDIFDKIMKEQQIELKEDNT